MIREPAIRTFVFPLGFLFIFLLYSPPVRSCISSVHVSALTACYPSCIITTSSSPITIAIVITSYATPPTLPAIVYTYIYILAWSIPEARRWWLFISIPLFRPPDFDTPTRYGLVLLFVSGMVLSPCALYIHMRLYYTFFLPIFLSFYFTRRLYAML